jgi:hypothetical protein
MGIFRDETQCCLSGADAVQRELQKLNVITTLSEFLVGGGVLVHNENETTGLPLIGKSFPSENARRVHFNPTIEIVKIPSHIEYPDMIKKSIWSSSAEVDQNSRRNRREFAAEDWKWKDVIEEDQMFFDKRSNEHIHPVHLGGIMYLR